MCLSRRSALASWTGDDDRPDMADDELEVFGEPIVGAAILRDGFETGSVARWDGS